jgi:hypothetical protein
MASIKKRDDGAWRARYRDEAGKEHARHFARKVDAQRWLDGVTTAVVTGSYVDPRAGLVTVGELHTKWVGTQGHLKTTTVATRAVTWSAHVEPRWARMAVADVQTSAVRSWVGFRTWSPRGRGLRRWRTR